MVFIEVCVGSSCHLKGSPELVELLENAVKENHLEDEVVLSGRFCIGKCNRVGVTVTVNDEIFIGITRDNFREFWENQVMKRIRDERG
ncbi:MAG: NAD(P)H-dependent oxidoreductase subunit E [Clostridia bacterium]|nr:NAD(P)H-dependent oxidoreductase subunit E [Clostridia bacterium]MDY6184370.1 NAD(P)H-dependent oxidoreductase subunit E [Eubacteriales bacterium]